MPRATARSARNELRALIEAAFAKETAIPDDVKRRITERLVRKSARFAEIGRALADEGRADAAPATVPPASAPVEVREAFDPYSIGAVVTLVRSGRDALMDRLQGVARVEDLRSLAAAQNLFLPPGHASAEDLRAAIVESAEQRLAERRAAAS